MPGDHQFWMLPTRHMTILKIPEPLRGLWVLMVTFRDSLGFEDFLRASLVCSLASAFHSSADFWIPGLHGESWPLAMPSGNTGRGCFQVYLPWDGGGQCLLLLASPSGPTSSSSTPSCPYQALCQVCCLSALGSLQGAQVVPWQTFLFREDEILERELEILLSFLCCEHVICLSSWAKQTSLQFSWHFGL